MYTVFIKRKEILESEVKMKPSDSFTVLIRRLIAVLSRKKPYRQVFELSVAGTVGRLR